MAFHNIFHLRTFYLEMPRTEPEMFCLPSRCSPSQLGPLHSRQLLTFLSLKPFDGSESSTHQKQQTDHAWAAHVVSSTLQRRVTLHGLIVHQQSGQCSMTDKGLDTCRLSPVWSDFLSTSLPATSLNGWNCYPQVSIILIQEIMGFFCICVM